MNLGPEIVSGSYKYLLVQSGNNPITLGANANVNWNAGGVVATTGAQTISGAKTFASNINAASFGSGASNLNSFGITAAENDFGSSATYNGFGYNCADNNFGSSAGLNLFGFESEENQFGQDSVYNSFGYNSQNSFGELGSNSFGGAASTNSFGDTAASNSFWNVATTNTFGEYASTNKFGENAATNNFGSNGLNTYLGTCLFASTGRMRLANFTGAANQTGLRGEARVSGSFLYVCTGSTSGWARVQLVTF